MEATDSSVSSKLVSSDELMHHHHHRERRARRLEKLGPCALPTMYHAHVMHHGKRPQTPSSTSPFSSRYVAFRA
eukprot:scaffold96591_cov35-Tisochrysis_lutea.AAC.2